MMDQPPLVPQSWPTFHGLQNGTLLASKFISVRHDVTSVQFWNNILLLVALGIAL